MAFHHVLPGQAHRRGKGGLGPASEQALSEEPCPSSGVFRILRPFPPSLSSAALLDLPSDDGLSENSSEAVGATPSQQLHRSGRLHLNRMSEESYTTYQVEGLKSTHSRGSPHSMGGEVKWPSAGLRLKTAAQGELVTCHTWF